MLERARRACAVGVPQRFSMWEVIMARSRSSDIESIGSKGSHRVGRGPASRFAEC